MLTLGVVLVAVFINPLTERVQYTSPLVFMLSHYALFGAGLLFGYALLTIRRRVWFIGVGIAVIWHVPQMFALSAGLPLFRGIEEATMLLGGVLIGSNTHTIGQKAKLTLITLWLLGDTILSVIFIGEPALYSHINIPYSPYEPLGFPPTGVAMVLLMNAVLIYIVYSYVRRVSSMVIRAQGASDKRNELDDA
ncbi:MAG: DUF1404 domain-containing protein [Thermoprotei archaeon]